MYFNYHKHSYNSNTQTIDSTVSNEEYAIRSIELGHKWISSCEHGGAINFVDCYNVAKKHNLHYVHVGEFYFVENRLEKDKSNYHIIIVAKTYNAMRKMNYIMSIANEDGYYYKPRIDISLIKQLPKNEFYITTACVGGMLRDYPQTKDLFEELIECVGKENIFLEVQPHKTSKQIQYNKLMKELSVKYGLKMVGGTDSHVIYQNQEQDRDYLLKSKGLIYEDEDGWYLDYPTKDVLFNRFKEQLIWCDIEIDELLKNTLLLANTDEIVLNNDLKIPTIFQDKDREWRLGKLKRILLDNWNAYKKEVDSSLCEMYQKEIQLEFDIIEQTKMEDYFLTNYYIIKRGVELGGVITRSGRGSSPSFIINMLLGFTTIDRLKSKLPIIPHRFMSISRILETKQSPDIDFNIYHRERFFQAQDELFGENSNYLMMALGTLGTKSAFKMLCRAKDIEPELANEISQLIAVYEKEKKYNETAKIEDYVKNPVHVELLEESSKYQGIIDSVSEHPCATCLANEDLREAFGLIRTRESIVVNITGSQAEKLGYLKNDFLIVDVVDLNNRLYKRVGREFISSQQLYKEIEQNPQVFDLFTNGYTLCLNQFESNSAKEKMMNYSPRSVEEVANSTASIRPGFASNYKKYESREKFEYGIPFIDKLLQGKFLDNSFMLYQEQQMLMLMEIGIPMDKIVTVIKAISKKNIDTINSVEKDFKEKLLTKCVASCDVEQDKIETAIADLWKIFVDSANYAFNTPHALATATDCLHTALIKHLYPLEFYEVALQKYSEQKNVKKIALLKNEAKAYKDIVIPSMRYGQNNTRFVLNKETNEIYQSLLSIKGLNNNVINIIYEIYCEYGEVDNFFKIYTIMKEKGLSKTHIENLIKIGYFDKMENNRAKMLWLCGNMAKLDKVSFKKEDVPTVKNMINFKGSVMDLYAMLKEKCVKETDKLFKFDKNTLPKLFYNICEIKELDKLHLMYYEAKVSDSLEDDIEDNFLFGSVVKYNASTNKLLFKHIKTGKETWFSSPRDVHIKEKQFIFIHTIYEKKVGQRIYYTAQRISNLSEEYQ